MVSESTRFESWLDKTGLGEEEVTSAAIKAVVGQQLTDEMKRQRITKTRMAELMRTSRAELDCLLDPDNDSATVESLRRAAPRGPWGGSCG